MLLHRNKKIRTSKVSPIVVGIVAVVMVLVGIVVWKNIEKSPNQVAVELAPGEFPKKAVEQPVELVVTQDPMQVPAPTQEANNSPVTLTADQASNITVVVNKKNKLPNDYVPTLTGVRGASMRPEAASALETLLTSAESAGLGVKIISSYRSYNTQVNTYNGYVNQYGQAQADTFSARPGHSEHQTGLAVDVGGGGCDLEICFGNTPFGEWLKTNVSSYGFIIRYEEGKQALTGYQYEPWHLRYVGNSVATAIQGSGQTLDQYYGVPAGGY